MRPTKPCHRVVATVICLAGALLTGCGSSGTSTTDNSLTDQDDSDASDELQSNSTDELFCPVGALYDEQEDACYIDCDGLNDDQCDDLDRATFGDFDEFIDEDFEGSGLANQNDAGMDSATARYSIDSELALTEIENQQPENDEQFRQIWSAATGLLPMAALSQNLSEFQISSDGQDGTLAFVAPDENQPGKWVLAFDNADFTSGQDAEFIHTTVHEFGHIVFLQTAQVDMTAQGDCPNYAIMEGCTLSGSYINLFYQQFWLDIIDEHTANVGTDEDEQAIAEFYEKYQDRFVSEYSATNPVEDAAEIFTRFVLTNKPSTGGSLSQQKILSLYDYDELVQLRHTIRGKLNGMR